MAEDLVLDIDFNITKAEAKTNKLKREFEESKRNVEEIKNSIKDLTEQLELEKGKQAEIREIIKEQVKEADELARKIEKVESGNATIEEVIDLGNIDSAKQKLAEMESEIQKNERELEKTYNSQKKTTSEIRNQNNALAKQNGQTATIGEKLALSTQKTSKFSTALKNSAESAKKMAKRVGNLAASALLFSTLTKAFTALREKFGEMINEQGTKTAELTAKLKGGLAVIGTTLYESAQPAIEWILNALVKMVNILANGLAKILGKDINEMKKLAQQTKKTGEEAKKATAGFDTLQMINTSSKSSSSSDDGAGTDFSALNDGIDSEIALLMAILSGAALILGVILAFTGAAIGLGIALMVIGAIGLVTAVVANWDSLSEPIKNTISAITAIVSAALLVLGVIFAFAGVKIGLGIAFMVLGAAGLVATKALAWSSMPDKTKQVISWIMAIGGLLMLVIGIILCCADVIPLGIAFIVLGAAALVGSIALNWNAITDKVKKIATSIGNIFKKCWNGIKSGFKAMVNGIIGLANLWIKGLNLLLAPIRGIIYGVAKAFGSDVKFDDIAIPTIPKLATGAVLPGGSPMLAWVNDQPKGQGYIEGSVENIAAAFEKYLSDHNFGSTGNLTLSVEGNMAQFMRMLNIKLKREENRASINGGAHI